MRSVFLDRDGVLVEDDGLVTDATQFTLRPGVGAALRRLKEIGFRLVIVTNQAVVARGLIAEPELIKLHRNLEALLMRSGAPRLDAIYFCPHHPNADLSAYRKVCECRKPRPGMLIGAAKSMNLDLASSFMVGDRITDIAAGYHAGCRTALVTTGRHRDKPIEGGDALPPDLVPDFTCSGLPEAADWILSGL